MTVTSLLFATVAVGFGAMTGLLFVRSKVLTRAGFAW